MDRIKENIIKKFEKYNLGSYEELSDKEKLRLYEIENVLINRVEELNKLITNIRRKIPNLSNIIESPNVNISRKTVYNNNILKKYIDESILDLEDYFNEKKYKNLERKYSELEELYNKVIINIIEDYEKKIEIETLNREINGLRQENLNLKNYIKSKDNQYCDNIIFLNKNRMKGTNDE